MRIAIDARWITPNASGIGVYTQELLRALAVLDRNNEYIVFFDSAGMRERTIETAALRNSANVSYEVFPHGIFSPMSQLYLPGLLKRLGINVFHSPNYMIPLLAFPRNGKGAIAGVITIHDVIPMIFPDHAPKSRKTKLFPLYRRLMIEVGRRAHMIIADSDSSRRDIITHLRIPTARQERIKTVYCGLGSRLNADTGSKTARSGNEQRTILYVGRSDPYKNCIGLISAFALVQKQCQFPVRLIMAGPPDARYPEIDGKIDSLGLRSAVERRYFTDLELATAYITADLLVLPSLYEGFGLPVLEAMAFGTPVVCSNRGSLPEVAGEAAIQVDPTDIAGLAAAMTRVLTNQALSTEMSAKGLRQAAGFTWQRAASQTLAVYQQAAKVCGTA
ncbi:MAG: glycosyltransferase family 1 protein [bacterium]